MKLRLLATTDLHAHVLSWDYDKHQIALLRGLSRVASLIVLARAESENVLLFDNGDFLNGSGLGDHFVAALPHPHPMIAAMNHLQYDAATIGNHELSYGIPYFNRAVAPANFPLICSNFDFGCLANILPYDILQREMQDCDGDKHTLKIGIIGLMPAQTMIWESRHLGGIAQPTAMVLTAQNVAIKLRAMGADVVVALAHSGIGRDDHAVSEETAAAAIAAIAEIDAVIAGHTHEVFPPQAAPTETALVMPGFYGSHLGVIDLDLQKTEAGWTCIGRNCDARPTAYRAKTDGQLTPIVCENPEIAALAMDVHLEIISASDAVIGHSDIRLHSYFAMIADCTALDLIARAQADYIQQQLPDHSIPVLSIAAPFKVGGRGGPENYVDLLPGKLRIRHASDLYMHPNQLVGFAVTGAEVKLWLERTVSVYNQILPGAQDAQLIDDDFPNFNFDVIFGVQYEIDLTQPARFDARGQVINAAASRICNLRYQGAPVQPAQPFIVASNSFRVDGKMGFAGTDAAQVVYQSSVNIRDIVCAYLIRPDAGQTADVQRWGFAPQPNTTVIFQSSPLAIPLLQELHHLRIEPLQRLETGFQRFRLHL